MKSISMILTTLAFSLTTMACDDPDQVSGSGTIVAVSVKQAADEMVLEAEDGEQCHYVEGGAVVCTGCVEVGC